MALRPEHIVVTGGNGLVGANIAREILERLPDARITIVDLVRGDALVDAFFAAAGDRKRVFHRPADLRDPDALSGVVKRDEVTHVVHAAAVAHVDAWERETPRRYFDVNLGATLNVVEWARTLPGLRRLLYVSTGGVYGCESPLSPEGPQPEGGPFYPPELYAISKFAAERAVQRMGQLYSLDVRAIRLSAVFGPMERPSGGRTLMSLPYFIARAIGHGRPLRLTARTLEASGDFLSAADVAAGAVALLLEPTLLHVDYNVAGGHLTPVRELIELAAMIAPLEVETVDDPTDADFDQEPGKRRARWNAYEIARIRADVGWSPRPIAEQFRAYLRWALENAETRCPEPDRF
jgi:nucleoside-diphosphate-sugar epimerase